MPRSQFVDFRAVKAAITMEQVLKHYGLLEGFKKGRDSLTGPCPIHKGSNPTQFRVSTVKNIWNCFSECKHGGNTLDFIAEMEKITIHAAAVKAIEWFHLDTNSVSAPAEPSETQEPESVEDQPRKEAKPAAKKTEPESQSTAPNKPLKFRLDKLEREHPYLIERGLTQETIIDFGVGYCAKGMMAERIAIPIHNAEGGVVAYLRHLRSERVLSEKTISYHRKQLDSFLDGFGKRAARSRFKKTTAEPLKASSEPTSRKVGQTQVRSPVSYDVFFTSARTADISAQISLSSFHQSDVTDMHRCQKALMIPVWRRCSRK